jgi:hypothetical protein
MVDRTAKFLPQQKTTRTVLLRAGAAYGILFGLGFAIFVWGYDALSLYLRVCKSITSRRAVAGL